LKTTQDEFQNKFATKRMNMMSFKDLTTRAAEAEKTKKTDAIKKDSKVTPINIAPQKAAQKQQKPKG
jgi:hypothetical protein